jgi:DNA-binding NtrC family response regulator
MLSGCRVLVAEDDALVAEEISNTLSAAEGIVIGPVGSVREARARLNDGTTIDAALLDLTLKDGAITPVLETLLARGLPVVVYTGGVIPDAVRARHPGLRELSKPVPPARLIAELRRVSGMSAGR